MQGHKNQNAQAHTIGSSCFYKAAKRGQEFHQAIKYVEKFWVSLEGGGSSGF